MTAFNYLTIDFEDWYQGLTSTSSKSEHWDGFEKRINTSAGWLLKVLENMNIKATFFILGKVAEEYPDLVRKIAEGGHSIAAHSYLHKHVNTLTPHEFEDDLIKNIHFIENACGKRPLGFRAPCFSVNSKTTWAWNILGKHKFIYDSSIFPIRTPLYGMPNTERTVHKIKLKKGSIWEYPLTTVRIANLNLPFSGGFYFRFLPYAVVRSMTRLLNDRGISVVFYFHPWEFDPHHPMPDTVTFRERLSHYWGLKKAQSKFKRLLCDFDFIPIDSSIKGLDES